MPVTLARDGKVAWRCTEEDSEAVAQGGLSAVVDWQCLPWAADLRERSVCCVSASFDLIFVLNKDMNFSSPSESLAALLCFLFFLLLMPSSTSKVHPGPLPSGPVTSGNKWAALGRKPDHSMSSHFSRIRWLVMPTRGCKEACSQGSTMPFS